MMSSEKRLKQDYLAAAGEAKDTAKEWSNADSAWPDDSPHPKGEAGEPKPAEYSYPVKCPKCGLEVKICCEKHLKDWYCWRCRSWLDGHGIAGPDEPVLGHRGGT